MSYFHLVAALVAGVPIALGNRLPIPTPPGDFSCDMTVFSYEALLELNVTWYSSSALKGERYRYTDVRDLHTGKKQIMPPTMHPLFAFSKVLDYSNSISEASHKASEMIFPWEQYKNYTSQTEYQAYGPNSVTPACCTQSLPVEQPPMYTIPNNSTYNGTRIVEGVNAMYGYSD